MNRKEKKRRDRVFQERDDGWHLKEEKTRVDYIRSQFQHFYISHHSHSFSQYPYRGSFYLFKKNYLTKFEFLFPSFLKMHTGGGYLLPG